jgi:uncharacterized protein (DUF2235 family)
VQNLWGIVPTDVEQVWFPGVHCDVGGGYPEDRSGLSAIALQWMVGKAEAAGLFLDQDKKAIVLPQQSTTAYAAPDAGSQPPNESLSGLWWIAEYLPKRYKDPAANFATRWMLHAGRPRHVNPKAKVHASVFERIRLVQGYQPPNLPVDVEEVQ